MPNIEDVRKFAAADQGLAVVATTRDDGSVHSTVVNAGVMAHPLTGDDVVAFVVLGTAYKRILFERRGNASIVFRSDWSWVGAEGSVLVIGPDNPHPEFSQEDLPQLLRDVFSAAGGIHDDWDEYDRVMAEERRAAVLLTPRRFMP